MSAGKRALVLILPLIAFAIGGGFYVPVPNSGFDTNTHSALALKDLPQLPDWAREPLPDFSQIRDTTEKKAAFFSFLYPRIVLANSRVLLERNYLMRLKQKPSLTAREKKWLQGQADRLKIDAAPGSQEQWRLLEKRLDVIPPSLIMAQAANESAWGTSRFARKGNNLFGQWCFSKGCGLVPRHRVEGANHEVASFSSPYGSIRAYIQNLNRHATYQSLREIRVQDREQKRPLSGIEMAQGLLGYSERGKEYVKEIRGMIHYNNLEFYDDDFRATVKDRNLTTLQQLASTRSEDRLLPRNTALSDNAEG
ncbi:bax protein [Marinobacter santoriniensis NKSG1]|uniref:Bax protein n=1 Tax=Marinobacter santoriniensis NKSG1 TaxID=1288826 RepID=M7DE92_9GAMM|nr:glucosaminidase domain-containing protein [Marinobacter santoriniensis]EMP55977.1 bax protein [Marinobacter santoriniensis NKSG1]